MMIMNIHRDIALNALEDAYSFFMKEFAEDIPDYEIARHIVNELRSTSYDDLSSLAYHFMHLYPVDQWSEHLYAFFHSEGVHRTKVDDLLEAYWDFMDEEEEQEQEQEQGQEAEAVTG